MADDVQESVIRSKEFGTFDGSLSPSTSQENPGTGVMSPRAEMATEVSAARRKWNIPSTVFERLAGKMEEIAMQGGRNSTNAAKLLLEMNDQNGADQATADVSGNVVIFLPDNGRGKDD